MQNIQIDGKEYGLLSVYPKTDKKFIQPDLSQYGKTVVVEQDKSFLIYFRSHYIDSPGYVSFLGQFVGVK